MENDSGIACQLMWLVGSLVCIGIGIVIQKTPAERHLWYDRRTGYWFYRRELERTGDEKLAIAAAAKFYWQFGIGFIIMGSIHFITIATILLTTLLAP